MSIDSDFRKTEKALIKAIEKTVRGTVLSLSSEVIADTPVDTGELRGRWAITYGAPIFGQVGPLDKSGSLARGAIKLKLFSYKIDKTIIFFNNADHAIPIEEGTKHIDAHHMLGRNVDAFRAQIEKNAAKNRIR